MSDRKRYRLLLRTIENGWIAEIEDGGVRAEVYGIDRQDAYEIALTWLEKLWRQRSEMERPQAGLN